MNDNWIIAAVWAVCGVVTYGMAFAFLQKEFAGIADERKREDAGYSAVFALGGPITLLVLFFMTGFCTHGLKFK